ncbi:head decoration protein [Azospirillum sp. B4]|uniref:head decoration protein n=1 Tax=Azospirillum sp. B4 TaxID=95605 RepID=UPI00034D3119|nr:head decoration protein [Azospirillum sp. B4]
MSNTAIFEGRGAGEYIVSEANGHRSRGVATLTGGGRYQAGTVLGRVLISTATAAAAGNTGNGTIGAITVGAAKQGAYRLVILEPGTNAGAYSVEDPDGINVGDGVVGAAFTGGGLSFTLADGSTDFVAGDSFTITVAAGSGKVKPLNLTATDGTQTAYAILYATTDVSGADQKVAIHDRDMEANGECLTWPVGITDNQNAAQVAALATHGIIVR